MEKVQHERQHSPDFPSSRQEKKKRRYKYEFVSKSKNADKRVEK